MFLKQRLFHLTVVLCLLLAAGLAFLGGCGLLSHRRVRDGFPHAPHTALGIECGACHQDYDRSSASGMPTYGTCQACHGESDDREPYPYEAEIQTHAPKEAFVARARYDDLVFSHAIHTDNAIPCDSCHPDPDEPVKPFAAPARHADRCESCHRNEGISSECSVCHTETRRDRPPASHERLTWGRTHGRDPVHGWDSIHQRSCSLCHAQSYCDGCHQVEKPQDHSEFFRQRGHGFQVGIERERCTACHQESFCTRCHNETAPRSHFRASWGGMQSNHCLSCHEPLGDSRCRVCHQSGAPSHLNATRIPGPPHPNAASDCYRCHLRPPHADNGSPCTICHKP